MLQFIPLDDTINDFQKLLKSSALTGKVDVSPKDLINQLRAEPIYDVNYVMKKVTEALVASNPKTNCIEGNDTEHVVVTNEKLNEVLSIILDGGMPYDSE